jgi:AraC family transcriptional regulator, positive regulator of tynA and feaB
MSTSAEATGRRRWSTEAVEPRQALAYWIDTVCDRFLALEIDTPAESRFRASLDQVELGVTTANFIQAASQRVRRTPAKIARSAESMFVLLQLRQGHMHLAQGDKQVRVDTGQSVLINATEPYMLECPVPTSALALRLPEPWLSRWLPDASRHALHLFQAEGWNAALNAALASLDPNGCDALALPKGAVAEQLAALLALAVGRDAIFTPDYRLIEALRRTLRERLHEAELSPSAIASRHRISLRRLHYAFAAERTTFSAALMQLRLERARQLLSEPRLTTLPVAEIAARCGFADPSHFARRFRQAAGLSPLAFRASVLGRKH